MGGSPFRKRAAELVPPLPAAIRPVARLPDWAFTAAAQAAAASEAACHRPVPPLWQAPCAVHAAPRGAVAGPGLHSPVATNARSDCASPPTVALQQQQHTHQPHHHPTVMLFGTNLRLVVAKPPSPPVSAASAAAAPATVLQSLEEKIKELNEVLQTPRASYKNPLATLHHPLLEMTCV